MKKQILNIVKPLSKTEQQQINGGSLERPCFPATKRECIELGYLPEAWHNGICCRVS